MPACKLHDILLGTIHYIGERMHACKDSVAQVCKTCWGMHLQKKRSTTKEKVFLLHTLFCN